MPIDFSSLVLAPNMDIFSRPVVISPLKSQPNIGSYAARGIWTMNSVNIVTEEGGQLSSTTLHFGIKLSDFVIAPKQGDWISTTASQIPLAYWQGDVDPNANVDFIVDNFSPDGQGGADLILKRVTP
jgi:hypothetical protein